MTADLCGEFELQERPEKENMAEPIDSTIDRINTGMYDTPKSFLIFEIRSKIVIFLHENQVTCVFVVYESVTSIGFNKKEPTANLALNSGRYDGFLFYVII